MDLSGLDFAHQTVAVDRRGFLRGTAEKKGPIVNTHDGTKGIRLSFKRTMIEEFQEGRREVRPAE
jgi:hypothetical protein